MKMIEVFGLMAKGEIKEGTKLVIGGNVYSYIDTYTDDSGCSFVNEEGYSDTFLEDEEMITQPFLNLEVELIPPKEKKYLVKFNMRGLKESEMYLNYQTENDYIFIDTTKQSVVHKTHFTKSELQSIQLVREFLEDMEGKYQLIEVEE
ncbi:hypothetical protein MMJ46_03265 [Enterococcus cecorum]|uniref:hypothetical protein n=1 Tax=Enterococcus cecorum TaxID=44008 RepID=UPI001FAE6E89|nr:hypothetical protein [Enterococcus cecorum]MCJ0596337.1 hypothetical protein [Enterococcus cecorum]